jgi:hypothetical protein
VTGRSPARAVVVVSFRQNGVNKIENKEKYFDSDEREKSKFDGLQTRAKQALLLLVACMYFAKQMTRRSTKGLFGEDKESIVRSSLEGN